MTDKKAKKPATTKQFGLRTNDTIAKMIDDIVAAEGHNSAAGAIIQSIRDKHQHLVEVGRILRPGEK